MRRALMLLPALLLLGPGHAAGPGGEEKHPANRLAKESSPYLLQHAHNPVNWYPWGEEAFAKARKENKPVFLSIGYSSCHWCHVMERESFQNEEIAKILNEHFVAVKVDREERPDVDEVYMSALQVMGRQGGWPLSMFLTPDGKPFFGGTYWPPDDREIDGQTISGFKTLLQVVARVYKEQQDDIREQADQLAKATRDYLERSAGAVALGKPGPELTAGVVEAFSEALDPVHGGIGRPARDYEGTKFPMPAAVGFLLGRAHKDKDKGLREKVDRTLEKMAHGGIYDQLGGGFHRYSTERTWTVPHFEKMLYDNAQLVELYARAYRLDPKPLYRRVIDETLAFVEREMTSPDGAFYSALDADSAGKEGEFYVWTTAEIDKLLDPKEAELFKAVYVEKEPNFEEKYTILKAVRPVEEVAKEHDLSPDALRAKLDAAKDKLLAARAKRERPFLDTKVLTAWNGQMIAAYALAGEVLERPEYVARAKRAAEFVLKNLRTDDGRLLRTWFASGDGKGGAKLNAYLDDYAYLIHGLLNLHDATGEKRWLDEAKGLADAMAEHFADAKRGGFFYTSHDHEKLFARTKDHFDGAQPSGNSVAVNDLVRLWQKTGEKRYKESAEKALKLFAGVLENDPSSMPALAAAMDVYLSAAGEPEKPGDLKKPLGAGGGARKSDAVVKVKVLRDKPGEGGGEPYLVEIAIDKPYHIYANPPGSKLLEGAETTVEFRAGGKKLDAKLAYPKGEKVEDKNVGAYFVYEGKVSVRALLPPGSKPDEVRVKLQACTDRGCLLPAEVKKAIK